MKIGCVEYINAFPFSLPFQLNKIQTQAQYIFAIPSRLNALLREGKLDIALTSCVEYFDGEHQLLPGYCIAAHQQILSVNLYTQLPVEALGRARIGLTHHSATSISLLKVLCQHFWKVKPRFEPLNRNEPISNYSAILLIGDEALKNLTLPPFKTIDLAQAWNEATSLPFVFAVFVVRKQIELSSLVSFQNKLEKALQWSEENREYVEKKATRKSNLPPELICKYYSLCTYRLAEKELEGLEKFRELRNVPEVFT